MPSEPKRSPAPTLTAVDVCVIGLGAMGSAAAKHLAARGARVLGLEAFERGHGLGSSGGLSRIIRLAYFEHPDYVPLLRKAWTLWRDLERETGLSLLQETGGLYLGPGDGELVAGARRSAETHGLAHELLDAAEIARRHPALRPDPSWVGLAETQAGVLAPERCIEAHLGAAERDGAVLHFGERVVGWRRDGDGVLIETTKDVYRSSALVITAGAWLGRLVPSVAPFLQVERVPLHWFAPTGPVGPLPVWIAEDSDGDFYGFPLDEHGLKLARHGTGDAADPDTLDRSPRPSDEERVRAFARRRLPVADGPLRSTQVCMYTRTPDGHFVIDRTDERVIYASACSGHGFKFSSVVGLILADLALAGRTGHPIAFLSAARFVA